MANRLSIGVALAVATAMTLGLMDMAIFQMVWILGFQVSDRVLASRSTRKR